MRQTGSLLLAVIAVGCATAEQPRLPEGIEAVSLLGDTLYRPPLSDSLRADRERRLASARADYDRDSLDADAIIWLGRRTAYLGRYREAAEIFTRGIAAHPDDARMFRHRGHRYITLRELDDAVADLTQAVELIRGMPDQIEPDGLPNARNEPRSTLHSNIWYHLGLAYYLRGEFDDALAAYRKCMASATNDDTRVAAGHWLYMILRRLGRNAEAAEMLTPITAEMDVIENFGYHRLLLMYRGDLPPDSLLDLSGDLSLAGATTGYGAGSWHLYNGREEEAFRIFEAIVARKEQWAAFGHIAAEAELSRR